MEFTNIGAVGQVGQPSMDGRPATAAAAPPAQVIIVQAPKMERSFEAYPVRPVFLFSAMQISFGALSIILGIANPLTCGFWGFVGFGIWGGVLYVLSGVFGILSTSRKTTCMIITHMVLSIIGAGCATIQLALGASGAYYDNMPPQGCYFYEVANQDSVDFNGSVAVDALLAICGIMEAIVAILASSVSCKVMCCSSRFLPTHNQWSNGNNFSGQVVYFGSAHGMPNVSSSTPVYNQATGYPIQNMAGGYPIQNMAGGYPIQNMAGSGMQPMSNTEAASGGGVATVNGNGVFQMPPFAYNKLQEFTE